MSKVRTFSKKIANFAIEMKKIDRATVQRILDAADIVEVVSDFVSLRRRGANYIGLCPFHNERTPSFSVSRAKGICKCFSCGKGGSPVNFLMELESMTYQEALRYLAKKYNIEIQEHEMTQAELEAETERESMLAVNQMAMEHFAHNLVDTADGRTIGLAYFRERGISDAMIKRFRLGYALDNNDDLYTTALRRGFKEEYLLKTGLCSRNNIGKIYDRFRGRVIYPVLSVSGKVVAFGGRTLRSDKTMAKYVNSPESIIYSKRRELYGLYHARQAIVKQGKCILVEGYMDVISMHQAGVENVVASSGTSLTAEQVRLIHRFTDKITVIYDADSAGVKASLRSIDMLLLEGMNVKVLSLPEGEDPDSFAQSHSSSEVEAFIEQNEIDFIRFKIKTLMHGGENDPMQRARVTQDIIKSISLVTDSVQRNVYITDCSRLLGIDDKVLSLQVSKLGHEHALKLRQDEQRSREMQRLPDDNQPQPAVGQHGAAAPPAATPETVDPAILAMSRAASMTQTERDTKFMQPLERELIRLIMRYAMVHIADSEDDQGRVVPVTVFEYIKMELDNDEIALKTPLYARVLDEVERIHSESWEADCQNYERQLEAEMKQQRAEGIARIAAMDLDLGQIEAREQALASELMQTLEQKRRQFATNYVERILASLPDDEMRRLTTDLVSDKHQLSKVHTKYTKIATEADRLGEVVPRAIYELKAGIVECEIRHVRDTIKGTTDMGQIRSLMGRIMELDQVKRELAHYLGERIIVPR